MKNLPHFLNSKISLIDIGAVGNPPAHWLPLKDYTDLVGFEPNEKSCNILNSQISGYASSTFFPYAIGQFNEECTFKITEHHECCSLLEPNMEWLDRFEYSSSFIENYRVPVRTNTLDEISELKNIKPDAVKIDAQGFELQILKGATKVLDNIFLLEIETGLHKNYINETTFDEICPFLKQRGFMCMELLQQPPQLRKNLASSWANSKGQAMACESIWMKDLFHWDKSEIDKGRLKKFLLLCWLFNYSDYALEILTIDRFASLFNDNELNTLSLEKNWSKPSPPSEKPNCISKFAGILTHLLPTPKRRNLFHHFEKIADDPNFFKNLLRIN